MNLLAVAAAGLFLAAIVVNVMAIVMGFRDSVKRGVIALMAALLLGGALSMGYLVAHQAAMAQVGAEEIRDQGDKETQDQIEELKNVENIDLGL